MTRVYRILRKPYAKQPLDGEGAFRFGGRWSSPGTRLAYTAEHLSLAMIEYFIHVDAADAPQDLVVATVEVPRAVSRIVVAERDLPRSWRRNPAPRELAARGDRFAAEAKAAILIVPSALAPSEANWLVNPRHREFPHIRLAAVEPFRYDPRFFR
ncbi:MAG: RES domain-containing protein [Acidobacteriota bacterium]|nr:RES domain-containing protein [Acidobacteriota bacterium]